MKNQPASTTYALPPGRLAEIASRQRRSRRQDRLFLALLAAATVLGIASIAAANTL